MNPIAGKAGWLGIGLLLISGCFKSQPVAEGEPRSVKPTPAPTRQGSGPEKAVPPGAPPTKSMADLLREAEKIPEHITDRNPNTLLGGERGMDHVGVVVPDLERAVKIYRDLGFSEPQVGTLPNGIKNANFYFGDSTYVELATSYDDAKAREVATFISRYGMGVKYFVLCVFAAEEARAFLKKRGVTTNEPHAGRIDVEGAPRAESALWHTFEITAPDPSSYPVSFIGYDRRIRNLTLSQVNNPVLRRERYSHQNKALGLEAIWIVVRDLAAAIQRWERIGFEMVSDFNLPVLAARGVDMKIGSGSLLLLQPRDPESKLEKLLRERGVAIAGFSVAVESLRWARGLVKHNIGVNLPTYRGHFGMSAMIPKDRAAGAWIELFERPQNGE